MVAKLNVYTFEDALTMAGFGKFNLLIMLVNANIIMGMAFEIFSVSYLVPASACELATTVTQQGLMAAVPMLGIIATSHVWGYLADTRGRSRVLCRCMALTFLAGSLAAFSPNWIVFSVLKFLSSCAVAGTFALALTLLSEFTLQARRHTMVALTSSIFLSCTGLMAVLSIPVLQLKFSYYIPYLDITFNSWRLLNLVFIIPCAFGTVCMYLCYESPRFLLMVGEEEKALEVLRSIYSINTGRPKADYEVHSLILGEDRGAPSKGLWTSIISQTLPLLKPPLLKNTFLLATMFVVVYFGINPFIVWLPFIVNAVMNSIRMGDEDLSFCEMIRSSGNTTTSGDNDCSLDEYAMTSVFVINVLLASMNVVLSSLVNKVGRKRMLMCIQIFAGISGLCINFSNIWKLNAVLLVGYIAGVLNFGYLATICVEVFPTYVKAMALCLTLMVGRGSSVLGISVLKNLLVTNCELAFYLFSGLTFAGGFFAILLPNDKKSKVLHKIDTDSNLVL